MEIKRVYFPCGELSLEGILSIPEGNGPFPAVIVCHPHPLYGGSMENNVVNSICETLLQFSIVPLKFNFRGAGYSQGTYDNGIGEQDDVRAAISFLTQVDAVDRNRIGLAGYSAGAAFGLPVGAENAGIIALAAVSPPFSMSDFSFLTDCLKPKLLISGSKDDFTSAGQFHDYCSRLSEPVECETIEDTDHFWSGYENELAQKVATFFARALASEKESE